MSGDEDPPALGLGFSALAAGPRARANSAGRRLRFAALSLLFFWVSAGTFSSLGVVLPAMVRDLGWTWTQAGLGYTCLGLACGLSSLAPAFLIRRIGVSQTLVAGSLLLIVGFGGFAAAHSVEVYLGAALVLGVAFSLTTTVPGTHVLSGLFKRPAFALGAYFTIGALGQVAGPLLYVGVESLTRGWRLYWWGFAAMSAAFGGFAALATASQAGREAQCAGETAPDLKGSAAPSDGSPAWTFRGALATPQYYVIVGAYTMYLLINTTAHGFAVEHLTERGVSARSAAAMLSLEALVGAVVSTIGGAAGGRVSPKTLMAVALAALTAGMAALAGARGPILMLGYALGVGIGFGLSFLAATLLLLNYFGRKANLELFSLMCLISSAAAAGPALGGWARDSLGSFSLMFLLCAGAGLAMLGATLLLAPPQLRTASLGAAGAKAAAADSD